jgi:hypothetical protein
MCDVESWSFAYHTKWNISKTKQENKYLSKDVTLQFSMIFQIRLKNNNVNFRVMCPLRNIWNATSEYTLLPTATSFWL